MPCRRVIKTVGSNVSITLACRMKTTVTDDRSPAELVLDTDRAMRAIQRAGRRALIDHKRRGDPIVVWEDGHAKWVPAEDIVVPDADPTGP